MGIQLNGTSGTDVISAVDGSLTIDGDIAVVDKIIHGGDTNTASVQQKTDVYSGSLDTGIDTYHDRATFNSAVG